MRSRMPVDGVPHADWPSRAAVQRRRRVSHATPRSTAHGAAGGNETSDAHGRLGKGNDQLARHWIGCQRATLSAPRTSGTSALLLPSSVPPRVPTPAGSSTVLLKSSRQGGMIPGSSFRGMRI
ncbi:hypothetical protein CSOJ01_05992 [Colletotrichum sojae]|uniref:Uncharacterized protein n=1 Tax=Colletotrichum sojae TaxID=2175907 RepID=A0A8H6MWQ4_9PEZI|nr:hypothetical protein CSOJ01_05992 [Colletotrichum sojae]